MTLLLSTLTGIDQAANLDLRMTLNFSAIGESLWFLGHRPVPEVDSLRPVVRDLISNPGVIRGRLKTNDSRTPAAYAAAVREELLSRLTKKADVRDGQTVRRASVYFRSDFGSISILLGVVASMAGMPAWSIPLLIFGSISLPFYLFPELGNDTLRPWLQGLQRKFLHPPLIPNPRITESA